MSSVLQPVGPEEPQVYWKRRALVAGVVVVALFVLWLVFKPSASSPEAEPDPVAATTGSATANPGGSTSASPSAVSEKCADSDIKVSVATDQTIYPAGTLPQITMVIRNTGTSACTRDIGSGANEVSVSSGGVAVYSSDTCVASNDSDEVTLEPGKGADLTMNWDRTNTTVGCNGEQAAGPGSYDAMGRNGQVASSEVSFVLQ